MKKIISAFLILAMIFSIVCVNVSATNVYINENFTNMDSFVKQFRAGAFFIEDGKLFGYSEAKALQSEYVSDDSGLFTPHNTCWLTYDAKITLSIGDDELSDEQRHINIVYCNDNPRGMGRVEERIYMAFRYDVENRCFSLVEGLAKDAEVVYAEPVYMEIPTEAEKEFTMGMSVTKDNIRCFYNDQLIFDYTNPEMLISYEIVSPFVFWQEGNYTCFSNITIADHGHLYPVASAPVVTENNGGNQGGNDTSATTAPKATSETTTRKEIVDVTDDKGNAVTDDKGNKVTEEIIVTEPPVADTNANTGNGGSSATTGDAAFIVVAAMVATLGCALIVRKVNVQ